MSDLKMNKEDGVESYEFATPEAIEEALKIGKLSQTVFGMGCFWGPDSNFGGTQGVVQTRVGYAGASTLDPSYRNINGHAEVVRVIYDKDQMFAGQVLCTMKAWESAEYCKTRLGRSEPLGKIDRSKLNVRGSSIALGHPFAATGAKIVGVLAKILHSAGPGKRGLIVVCTAGGMGVATILES